MKTINIRCCREPGLVLGRILRYELQDEVRVPKREAVLTYWPGTGDVVAPQPETLSYRIERVCGCFRDGRMWAERAVNSNHASLEELSRLPGFELVCNIPDEGF